MTTDSEVKPPSYFTLPDAPDLKMFRCARLRATLSDRACAANFLRSQKLRPDDVTGVHLCRECPIGSATAGVPLIRRSGLYNIDLCPRCRRYCARIINGTRCVGCANREYEWIRGANAKGTVPKMKPLLARRLRIVIGGQVTELRSERSRDHTELMLGVLRVAEGRAVFCRPRRGPVVSLVDWIGERRTQSGMNAQRANAAKEANEARRAKTVEGVVAAVADDIHRRAAARASAAWRAAEAAA
jgi:hypothetical protein